MGAELIKRGLTPRTGLWSARALLDEPAGVVQVHAEYIEAGASVITTNSYSTIPSYLAKAGMAERYQDLTVVAPNWRVKPRMLRHSLRVAGACLRWTRVIGTTLCQMMNRPERCIESWSVC